MSSEAFVDEGHYLSLVRYLCGKAGALPSSCFIKEGLQTVGDDPLGGGGFASVWQGLYYGQKVAIKIIRIYKDHDITKVQKRFCKEVITWRYLSHPNIVPFLGVSTKPSKFCMVSEWMENGTITEYLQQVLEIAIGLKYLHSKGVVHGDLKGANILVNAKLEACLVDFGLATAAYKMQDLTGTTSSGHGSWRWMAPEQFDPDVLEVGHTQRTTQTDIYSFAMVILEIHTGMKPFLDIHQDASVVLLVARGDRPCRGVDLVPDRLRKVMEDCWRQKPEDRPSLSQIIARI